MLQILEPIPFEHYQFYWDFFSLALLIDKICFLQTALIWLTNKFSSGVLDRPKCSQSSCAAEGPRSATDSICKKTFYLKMFG